MTPEEENLSYYITELNGIAGILIKRIRISIIILVACPLKVKISQYRDYGRIDLSYSKGKIPGLENELIQGYIEPVYRYHLARCENYLEAQNLTIQTLSTVMKSIDTYRSRQDSLKTCVMEIAYARQSFVGRHPTLAARSLASASSSKFSTAF